MNFLRRAVGSAPARTIGLAAALAATTAAGDAAQGSVAALLQSGAVRCEPAMPVFCSNIHVSCSGPTSTPTFPFTLRAAASQGSIESSADSSGIAQQYRGAHAQWDGEGGYVILRPQHTAGYIKLLADGTYSFRHYTPRGGSMSRGQCH